MRWHHMRPWLLVVLGGLGCVTPGPVAPQERGADEWAALPADPRAEWAPFPGDGFIGHLVASRAAQLVGLRTLKAAYPRLPDDCTGLVRAAWADTAVDLLADAAPGDNGVSAMWRTAQRRDALTDGPPEPGDLIFFRETYDRNRDGQFNDGLTHVAVVEAVAPDGTITYVHRASSGVTRARVNLSAASTHAGRDGSILNDWLRPRSRRSPAVLSGELFAGFASARRLAVTPPPGFR